MKTNIIIHCFSCGRDAVVDKVEQLTGKPIRRCSNCRSLNFKVLDAPLFTEEVIPLPEPEREEA